MKSTIISIVLLAMLLIATSGFGQLKSTIQEGEMAPEILLETYNDTLSLNSHRGENVLLTFWSSSDARSRVECNLYSAWIKANHPTQLRHLAINFDEHAALFEEIINQDNNDATMQYHAQGKEASRIIDAYSLDDNFGSLLIDPEGRIISINPSTEELSALINA